MCTGLAMLDGLEQIHLTSSAEVEVVRTRSVRLIWTNRHIDPALDEIVRERVARCAESLGAYGIRVTATFYTTCSDSRIRDGVLEYDVFAHLRPSMRRTLSERKELRIRCPDEIYQEWEREAEDEAARWEDAYEEDSDGSEEDGKEAGSTLIDTDSRSSRETSEEEENWMEDLVDEEEEDPFSDEHGHTTAQDLSRPRSRSPHAHFRDAAKCTCALIQHQKRKLQPRPRQRECITEVYGTRPDIPRILGSMDGTGRALVAVCSNSSIVREVRGVVAQMSLAYAKGRRRGGVEVWVEGEE